MAQAEIIFNEREALRYFRAAPGDTQAQAVVRQVYEELKTEMQPRYTVKKFGCQVYTENKLLQQCPQYEVTIRERKKERGNSLTALSVSAIVEPEKENADFCLNHTALPAGNSAACDCGIVQQYVVLQPGPGPLSAAVPGTVSFWRDTGQPRGHCVTPLCPYQCGAGGRCTGGRGGADRVLLRRLLSKAAGTAAIGQDLKTAFFARLRRLALGRTTHSFSCTGLRAYNRPYPDRKLYDGAGEISDGGDRYCGARRGRL